MKTLQGANLGILTFNMLPLFDKALSNDFDKVLLIVFDLQNQLALQI